MNGGYAYYTNVQALFLIILPTLCPWYQLLLRGRGVFVSIPGGFANGGVFHRPFGAGFPLSPVPVVGTTG
jgi:hypothetical protein